MNAQTTSKAAVDPPVRQGEAGSPPLYVLPLPHQIADHLGHRIMNGEYTPGSRLKEEKLAEHFGVSRGPVREAFRILQQRGLVEIMPRHGARVRTFDLAELGSVFTVRAVLLGLAAREATERATPEMVDRLSEQVARLRGSARKIDVSPLEHATISINTQKMLAQFSGNRPVLRMLEELKEQALWRMAWYEKPLDFTTRARRQQSAAFWTELLAAVKAGHAEAAERAARALLEASRDHMLAAMAALRTEPALAD